MKPRIGRATTDAAELDHAERFLFCDSADGVFLGGRSNRLPAVFEEKCFFKTIYSYVAGSYTVDQAI